MSRRDKCAMSRRDECVVWRPSDESVLGGVLQLGSNGDADSSELTGSSPP